nr:hypothetical protein [Tanacetum cinerariifolium]
MANLSKDIQCTGFDTRPPILDRIDFASWQQWIRLYCRGKENGVNILKSIDEGPYKMGTVRETLAESTEEAPQFGPKRSQVYSDLTFEEKDRFAKLINDMRNIKMTMSNLQLHSKFVNNMLPEWGRFVTVVKLNRGLRDSNYDQLYAYLKQHETHEKENKIMLERFSQPTVDPLALLSNVSNPQHYSPSSSASTSTQVPPPFDDSSSPIEDLVENLTNTLALLTQSYRTFLPQTNNQLRTSSNAKNQATVQDGRVVVQNVQGRRNRGQGMNPQGGNAAGYGGAQNRVSFHHLLPMFKQGDDPIDDINKMMSFLSTVVLSRFLTTNNQLSNSSNPRQQATIHDGRVTVQPVHRIQGSFAAGISGTRANISGACVNNLDIQCTGFDTRPPMLDRTDFASWQQWIRLYCRGKENGVNILKSIDEEPYKMGTVRETLAESTKEAPQFGPERSQVYSDLTFEEKDRYNADIRAINILLHGLPKDIYTLINHYTDAKDIWDNGESIHDYYVRFAKLINDMRNIKMTMSNLQLHSKFVNNMLPEWGRFVTVVKLNRGLRDSNYDQLYAYLKQHETHEEENKMMLERFSQPTVDPLALLSNVSNPQHYSPSSSASTSTQVPPPFDDSSYPTEDLVENLTNTLALLTQSYRTFLPQTNNQLRTSSNAKNQATIDSGLAVPMFKQGDDPIDDINKMMSFLSTVVSSRFLTTNNQLSNSSNPRQQATIHDGRVTVQPVHRIQGSFAA